MNSLSAISTNTDMTQAKQAQYRYLKSRVVLAITNCGSVYRKPEAAKQRKTTGSVPFPTCRTPFAAGGQPLYEQPVGYQYQYRYDAGKTGPVQVPEIARGVGDNELRQRIQEAGSREAKKNHRFSPLPDLPHSICCRWAAAL